jgi:hypothetical protein
MPLNIRGRVGGNLGTGLVSSRTIGANWKPLDAKDTKGIVKRFTDFINQVRAVAPRAARIALLPTFQKSQIYCPKKTGALVYSGYLEIEGRFNLGGRDPSVEIGYGKDGKPPYALIVHEVLNHYHKPPTRAKWLQVAMQEDRTKLLPRIASQLQV